jgi:CHAT domain-containing protein
MLLLGLFSAPLLGQTPTPEVFIQKVTEWLQSDDLSTLARGVRFQAEVGEQAFAQVLRVHQSAPSELTERWLNAVARAYRLEGNPKPGEQLSQLGILWPDTRWRGTMFEADQVVDTRGTVAEILPASTTNGGAEAFEEALAATHLAVRVGNDQALPSMLAALKAHLAKHPQDPRKAEVMVLEVSSLEATGLWNEALELGQAYASEVTGPEALALHLTTLSAARKLEKPIEVDKLLQRTRVLLDAAPNSLGSFIIESLAFERRCQTQEVTLEQLTQRHVEVWRLLREDDLPGIPGGQGRQAVEAAGVWVYESLRRLQQETDEFPNRAQLSYIVWEDLRRLKGLARSQLAMQFQPSDAQAFLRLWNPEFMLATQALELEVVGAFRRGGDQTQARRLLEEVGAEVQATWETIKEAGLGYQLAHYGNPIRLEGGQFEFVWTLGEAPRMVALQRLERAYLYDDENAVEEALVFQQDARSQGGFLGLEDARFLKVERLLKARKPQPAAQLNSELQTLCAKRGYRPGQIVCTINAAEIESRIGKKDKALLLAGMAVDMVEEYLAEAGGRAALRERFRRAYELLAQVQLEAGRGEDAFATLARLGQAQALMTRDADRLAANDPRLAGLVSELDSARTRGQALEQSRSAQASNGRPLTQVEGEIAGNRADFYKTLGEIRRQYPDYGQLLAVRPVNFARLQKSVPKDTVIVQTFPAQDALFLFVLTREQLKIHRVPVSQQALTDLVSGARRGLLRSRERGLNRAGRAVAPALAAQESTAESALAPFVQLHEYLIEPIAKEIEPYPVVAFIPSGSLMDLPLQALARNKGESLEFLIENKQVVTILKSSDLERLDVAPLPARGQSLVVGNPDGSLPAATEEAKTVAAMAPGSEILLGDQATLDRLGDLKGKSSWHLATHGVLDRDDPNRSYLVLAKGQQLGIAEIAAMDLGGLRLVTLSACETALGVGSQGQSELTTLADAFSFAGCPTVAASLWKVSDESTRLLMEKFYQELQAGSTPAAALQAAQKTLIAQESTRHPYHWAPFLLIGDWR